MAKLTANEITKMRIKRIEKEIRDTPYHKATEHHIGRLRAKLSKLKTEESDKFSKKSGGGASGSVRGYAVKKQGDATVALVGSPSVGKSTLLNKLTNAKSKIAPYAFTTVTVVPGMMEYKDARIQILDAPGLIEGAEEGKGRGREVLSVVRNCDLLIIMCDAGNEENLDVIIRSLEKNGIRINKSPPDVVIEKHVRGGLQIHSNIKQKLDKETIIGVAKEFGVVNGEITIKELLTMENLIDAFSLNRVYIPVIFVINKSDLIKGRKYGLYQGQSLSISAEMNTNLEKLKELIWDKLEFIRAYLVRPDEKPNLKNPVVLKKGMTLKDLANTVGTDFAEDKKRAKIWGAGAKFPGQEVSLKTKVIEGMQVRFI